MVRKLNEMLEIKNSEQILRISLKGSSVDLTQLRKESVKLNICQ